MAVKLQYNPSTGKLSFNASTGKLSVVDTGGGPIFCEDCSPSPDTVDVTISGLVPCCASDNPFNSASYSDELFTLINGTHTLDKSISIDCVYYLEVDITGEGAILNTFFANNTCDGTPSIETELKAFSISLNLSVGGDYTVLVSVQDPVALDFDIWQGWTEEAFGDCWSQTLSTPRNENCEDVDFFNSPATCIMAGGTAIISETP